MVRTTAGTCQKLCGYGKALGHAPAAARRGIRQVPFICVCWRSLLKLAPHAVWIRRPFLACLFQGASLPRLHRLLYHLDVRLCILLLLPFCMREPGVIRGSNGLLHRGLWLYKFALDRVVSALAVGSVRHEQNDTDKSLASRFSASPRTLSPAVGPSVMSVPLRSGLKRQCLCSSLHVASAKPSSPDKSIPPAVARSEAAAGWVWGSCVSFPFSIKTSLV